VKTKKTDTKKIRLEILQRAEENSMDLPELCYLIRQMLGMSQADFAKFIGVSNKTINELETGKKIPSIKILNTILKIVGLEIGIRPLRS
tara:strand:+ start:83 stop:349 length:267 start_codon:yes stop_codon:yes gene_type:complete